ncbi:hypothetical protein AB0C11_13840 [Streptomyces sp. NPDC039016]|uniref:hypothetical protein n=1 Tax=Streptomyces sp. NPDC039016 TaxID=3154330 RepID=UPI0033F177E3
MSPLAPTLDQHQPVLRPPYRREPGRQVVQRLHEDGLIGVAIDVREATVDPRGGAAGFEGLLVEFGAGMAQRKVVMVAGVFGWFFGCGEAVGEESGGQYCNRHAKDRCLSGVARGMCRTS